MRVFALLLCLVLAACVSGPAKEVGLNADEQELLRLHAAGLEAHLDSDIDALLAPQAEDFVLLNRGVVSSPTLAERRKFLGPYLAATKFEFYRDAAPPIVKLSRDRTLGWVIAQVTARGQSETSQGERLLEFEVAWIELYEKRGGRWVAIGNGSTFKGE